MSEGFEEPDVMPRDVRHFERTWLAALVVSAIIAIGMYDYSVVHAGGYAAAIINIALFVSGLLLIIYTARKFNRVSRFATIPFFLLILLYDSSHFGEMMSRFPLAWLAGTRLLLMAWGITCLFTPASRAWFAGRPVPEADLEL